MSDWDDIEDHDAAVGEAEAWEREQDYQADMAVTQHLEDLEAAEAAYPTGSDW